MRPGPEGHRGRLGARPAGVGAGAGPLVARTVDAAGRRGPVPRLEVGDGRLPLLPRLLHGSVEDRLAGGLPRVRLARLVSGEVLPRLRPGERPAGRRLPLRRAPDAGRVRVPPPPPRRPVRFLVPAGVLWGDGPALRHVLPPRLSPARRAGAVRAPGPGDGLSPLGGGGGGPEPGATPRRARGLRRLPQGPTPPGPRDGPVAVGPLYRGRLA